MWTYVSIADSFHNSSCDFWLSIKQTLTDPQLHLCLQNKKKNSLLINSNDLFSFRKHFSAETYFYLTRMTNWGLSEYKRIKYCCCSEDTKLSIRWRNRIDCFLMKMGVWQILIKIHSLVLQTQFVVIVLKRYMSWSSLPQITQELQGFNHHLNLNYQHRDK